MKRLFKLLIHVTYYLEPITNLSSKASKYNDTNLIFQSNVYKIFYYTIKYNCKSKN